MPLCGFFFKLQDIFTLKWISVITKSDTSVRFFPLSGGNKTCEFLFVSDAYRILVLYTVLIFIASLEFPLYLNLSGIALLKIIL